jgi:hypothetical protein
MLFLRAPVMGQADVVRRRPADMDRADRSLTYSAPAELLRTKPKQGSRERYRRFATAAEAIRYVVEVLGTPRAFGAWLQVEDERFNGDEIQRLYERSDYPLRRPG